MRNVRLRRSSPLRIACFNSSSNRARESMG
jgi:hypothetical protein